MNEFSKEEVCKMIDRQMEQVEDIIEKTKTATQIIAIDGCSMDCMKKSR